MRIALVSPYSWTYPGGVTRHIEALAECLIGEGHHVRVLAPFDRADRFSSVLHRGARPQPLSPPDYLLSLGRTVSFNANGAVSNLSITPYGVATMHRELRSGGYDVVHIHEPVAPVLGWVAADWTRLPLVGTFHTYNDKWISNGIASLIGARRVLNRLHVRIAVSEAAAWTGRRFFGGHYRVIPNGVSVDGRRALAVASPPATDHLRIVFVGQAVERKGLPLLLRAFEALREHIPCELTVIGPSADELSPLMLDGRGVRVLGKVDDEQKRDELDRADVLCAPSLRGESFGMVLTEAFAAGTPVVASEIAGYREVVRNGIDGVLVPPGDAQAIAEALRDLWEEPGRRAAMGLAAAANAERFAWPRVASDVVDAYEDAIATPAPDAPVQRAAVRIGARAADLKPPAPARRLPSLEHDFGRQRSALRHLRRGALVGVSLAGAVLGVLALEKIGIDNIASVLLNSSPALVLLGLALMCSAMVLRAVSWHAILKAALPRVRVGLSDAMQGTFIGVLMSSTLPARLGEPSRALVVARRTGRPRDALPAVLGTVVSQTLLNLVALAVLGAVMFSAVNVFDGHQDALLAATLAPLALVLIVVLAPTLLRSRRDDAREGRFRRAYALRARARLALARVRGGLMVFRRPRLGIVAAIAQLAAWGLQWLSCYVLLVALGLSHTTGIAAAAAVLFAVNVTAVLPATPANLGVFQAACAAVLHTGWHVGLGTGVAYGVILQAVEVTTAIVMGMPALLKEGMSWREIRMRAMHATPVKLPARPARRAAHSSAARRSGAIRAEG